MFRDCFLAKRIPERDGSVVRYMYRGMHVLGPGFRYELTRHSLFSGQDPYRVSLGSFQEFSCADFGPRINRQEFAIISFGSRTRNNERHPSINWCGGIERIIVADACVLLNAGGLSGKEKQQKLKSLAGDPERQIVVVIDETTQRLPPKILGNKNLQILLANDKRVIVVKRGACVLLHPSRPLNVRPETTLGKLLGHRRSNQFVLYKN